MKIKLISFYIFFLLSTAIYAQSTDNSPYSRLGIGDITSATLNGVYLGGDLASSYVSSTGLNPANPGSYGFLDYTVFDVGVYAKYAQLKDKDNTDKLWSGNLEYFSLGFPLRNINNEIFDKVDKPYKWGMNFTVKPYSIVNYSILSTDSFPEYGKMERTFEGNGGTYTFNWGLGYRYKNFGVGLNLGYLFGNISNEQYIDFVNDPYELKDEITNNYSVRGLVYNAGLIYRLPLFKEDAKEKKKYLTFGLRGNTNTSFKTDQEYLHVGQNINVRLRDTLEYVESTIGKGKLPATIGFGVNLSSGIKYTLGADVEYTMWTNYKNDARPDQNLSNSFKVSVGGTYLPDERGFGNFLERTTYKYGLYYKTDPRSFDNKTLTQYGVTLGMSMPFFYQKAFSRVNLGVDLGRKGVGSPIEENYLQIKLGINFNDDQWFLKTRYN